MFIAHLYFVSSRERPWRHWAHPGIHAARRILYASIPVFLFERVRKHTSCARDDMRLPPEYALTSRLFSRWDKVYTTKLLFELKQSSFVVALQYLHDRFQWCNTIFWCTVKANLFGVQLKVAPWWPIYRVFMLRSVYHVTEYLHSTCESWIAIPWLPSSCMATPDGTMQPLCNQWYAQNY